MKRYWVIAPLKGTWKEFDRAWEYDLKNGTIAVGWTNLGDISKLSKDELKKKFTEVSGERPMSCNMIVRFYHEIAVGDIVIARKGLKKMIGVGEVIGKPYYDVDKGTERMGAKARDIYSNFLPIKWQAREKEYDKQVFTRMTIYEIQEDKYKAIEDGPGPNSEDEGVEDPQEFIMEKYLEDFIVSNFEKIFGGKLELFKDEEEEGIGRQYPTDVGDIDILAKEPKSNSYVVIELKKGRSSDVVVGQILRYIGWVKENLTQKGEEVKGLIICREIDAKLKFALKAIPSGMIRVKRYNIDFKIMD